ncbi:MAG: hypothetical protein H8E26_09360 [FCB group bacterium]|nr:hypothetical protein [FCB group bacterium]MBL7029116.1 hypothetical protein [Candidatus Neomarinimicrobiota bacterium]MBL7122027.1 hypothetical protein [Candidatus Neomarinimicrobiota bacterium]
MISLLGLLVLSTAYTQEPTQPPAKLKIDKRMLKNFVKSLIIPGWGQWENGNKVRAVGYVVAEVAAIYGYESYHTQGEDLEQEFKLYGDNHWYFGDWSPNNAPVGTCGTNLSTHNMPLLQNTDGEFLLDENGYFIPLKDHHFYENIGKYPEFSCGWDDYTAGGVTYDYDEDEETHKAYYIDMRTRSNELYRNGQLAGTLIMVNHLISAFDAALGTDMTSFESTSFAGKFYINPLNVSKGITMEVTF